MMWLLYCCGCDFVHDKRLEKRRRQFWPYQAALQYLSRLLDSLWMIWQRRFGITLENRPLILSDFSFICSNVQEKKSWRVLSRKIYTSWVVKHLLPKLFPSVLQLMEEKSGGLACLLYSVVLSKGFQLWVEHVLCYIYWACPFSGLCHI